MQTITPEQLATILERAANMRPDVKKAVITASKHNVNLLNVDVNYYTSGRRVQRSASIIKIHAGDPPRNIGKILTDWLGSMPPIPKDQSSAMLRERLEIFLATPDQVLEMNRKNRQTPPTKPASKFDWSKSEPFDEGHVPKGVQPKPIGDPVTRGPNGRFAKP